jgi:hypothetical protein
MDCTCSFSLPASAVLFAASHLNVCSSNLLDSFTPLSVSEISRPRSKGFFRADPLAPPELAPERGVLVALPHAVGDALAASAAGSLHVPVCEL